MRTYDPKSALISLHIPKCAGASLWTVLSTWFGRRFHPHYFREADGTMPRKARLNGWFGQPLKRVCVHGHFNANRGFGVWDYYPDAGQFITVLRDPFEIHLSNFFYLKRMGHKMHRDGAPLPRAVDDDYDMQAYLDEHPRSFMTATLPFDFTEDNFTDLIEEHFVYVGIAEALQATVDGLAERLGFASFPVPKTNVSEHTQQPPPDARDRFRENNPLEFAVYEYARRRFDAA